MDSLETLFQLLRAKEQQPFLIAIDGRCASGKTTLSERLKSLFECSVVHMDDFYLPFSRRTEERMAYPGGNIDLERVLFDVLIPLKNGLDAVYCPYNCHTNQFLPEKRVNADSPVIIEGCYSCHAKLREKYDLRIFMDISPKTQKARLKKRNPSTFEAFQTIWIPREEQYFKVCDVRENCELILNGEIGS